MKMRRVDISFASKLYPVKQHMVHPGGVDHVLKKAIQEDGANIPSTPEPRVDKRLTKEQLKRAAKIMKVGRNRAQRRAAIAALAK